MVLDHITHLRIATSLNYVPARAFRRPNMEVVECQFLSNLFGPTRTCIECERPSNNQEPLQESGVMFNETITPTPTLSIFNFIFDVGPGRTPKLLKPNNQTQQRTHTTIEVVGMGVKGAA